MAHDVFISYSSKDKLTANAMCAIFESNGIRCWIAPRDILPGMDWGEAIIDAITDSQVMILILSANSNASEQVKREVERAVNKGIVIIPFRIEEIKLSKTLEYHLSVTHWMDALTPPIEHHILRLADRIKPLLSQQPFETASQQQSESAPLNPQTTQTKTLLKIGIAVLLLVSAAIGVYWQQILPENAKKTEPELTNSVTEIAGKWSGLALASGGQFQIAVEIYSTCQLNQKCGTISVSNVPCYGEIFLKQVNNGVYEFHVDNFDSRSDLKNCQAGAGEYFRLLEDGKLSYRTGYSDATATLEKTKI